MSFKRVFLLILMTLLMISLTPIKINADDWSYGEDKYYTIYDEATNKELFKIAWEVDVGDKYLSTDNKLYIITRIDEANFKGYAKLEKDIQLPDVSEDVTEAAALENNGRKLIAIYSTHSDESYKPSDGTTSEKGKGGIYDVDEVLKKALNEKGIDVVLSTKVNLPHDSKAYSRSRAIAVRLLQKRPDAILDIHRDAVPAEEYVRNIKGIDATAIRLVIGRRNQNITANENFAYRVKAVADKMYPGLIKDIYFGKGDYNQDLYPRSLLVEFGTAYHTKERAEKAADLFADVISRALYGPNVQKEMTPWGTSTYLGGERSAAGTAILIIIGVITIAGIAFVLLSMGGKEMRSKVSSFFKKEFASFLGQIRRRRGKGE